VGKLNLFHLRNYCAAVNQSRPDSLICVQWNGSLGRTANHAIVVAQLLVPKPEDSKEYVNHGPQPFIVQIRDMKTHEPLPGIAVGDIGPKYGYAPMDNGYMLFDHLNVPHSAMLSRYSMVDPNTCTYSKPANPAVVYGSLTAVRAKIVMRARLVLARAVTVAVRYTAIRRQFSDRDDNSPGAVELSVLDYRKSTPFVIRGKEVQIC
jgi:acyl-CoA oxidase